MSHYDEQEQMDIVKRELSKLCKEAADSAAGWQCTATTLKTDSKEFQDSIDQYYKEKAREDREIDRPFHYTNHPSGIECIQITEHMNFCLGNALKYIWRAGIKAGQPREKDLRKALWYINRELERGFKL